MDTTTAETIVQGTAYFWPIVLTLVVIGLSFGLPFLMRPGPDCRDQYKGPHVDQ